MNVIALVKDAATQSAAATTILQLTAASNHACYLKEIGIGFQGASPAVSGISVTLAVQTTTGTMSTVTEVKENVDDSETIQGAATHTSTSTEPTTTDELRVWIVNPTQQLVWKVSLRQDMIKVPGGKVLGLIANATAQVTCDAYMVWEE